MNSTKEEAKQLLNLINFLNGFLENNCIARKIKNKRKKLKKETDGVEMGKEQNGNNKKNITKLLMVFAIIIALAGIVLATTTILIPDEEEISENNEEENIEVLNNEGSGELESLIATSGETSQGSTAMVTKWEIPEEAFLEKEEVIIKLPVRGTVNIEVDWGDGSEVQSVTSAYPEHPYKNPGTYYITISGYINSWGIHYLEGGIPDTHDYYTTTQYLTGVESFGELNAKAYYFGYCQNLKYVSGDTTENTFKNMNDFQYMFNKCSLLESVDFGKYKISNVTRTYCMFNGCSSLKNVDLSMFDTSGTNMDQMFIYCSSLENITFGTSFDTSQVESFYNLFYGCSSLTSIDLSCLDTRNVKRMNQMFYGCSVLQDIKFGDNFDTSNVTNMENMFYGCIGLTSLDLSSFNTLNVTTMKSMFQNCQLLTSLDLTSFDTTKTENMYQMFLNCTALNEIKFSEKFNTINVTDMTNMFYNCQTLTRLDLTSFDTSNVKTLYQMFSNCLLLKEIKFSEKFNVQNVTTMQNMFYSCQALTKLDLSSFNTSKTENLYHMFYKCKSLKEINFGKNFNTENVITMGEMFYGCNALLSLDLTTFDTTKTENIENLFYECKSLKNIEFSKKFNTINITNMSKTKATRVKDGRDLKKGSSLKNVASFRRLPCLIDFSVKTARSFIRVRRVENLRSFQKNDVRFPRPNTAKIFTPDNAAVGRPTLSRFFSVKSRNSRRLPRSVRVFAKSEVLRLIRERILGILTELAVAAFFRRKLA